MAVIKVLILFFGGVPLVYCFLIEKVYKLRLHIYGCLYVCVKVLFVYLLDPPKIYIWFPDKAAEWSMTPIKLCLKVLRLAWLSWLDVFYRLTKLNLTIFL